MNIVLSISMFVAGVIIGRHWFRHTRIEVNNPDVFNVRFTTKNGKLILSFGNLVRQDEAYDSLSILMDAGVIVRPDSD